MPWALCLWLGSSIVYTVPQSQLELVEDLLILSAQNENIEAADEQFLELKVNDHNRGDYVKIIKIIL